MYPMMQTPPTQNQLTLSKPIPVTSSLLHPPSPSIIGFSISPREAWSVDPKALKNAGYVPDATPSSQSEVDVRAVIHLIMI
jgi:hypothetical protein